MNSQTTSIEQVKAVLFDVDGTIMPQGWPASDEVISVFRKELQWKILIWPSTGKWADYMRWVAVWMWLEPFNYIGAENGGLFMERTAIKPVTYKSINTARDVSDISEFLATIKLDSFKRKFKLHNKWVKYRPELKETMITLFPSGTNIDETLVWEQYFKSLIEDNGWELYVVRHPDGCIDIVPNGVSKANSVQEIMLRYNLRAEEILVAWDGKNDIWLFVPGVKSIVVANAHPDIKALGEKHGGYQANGNDGSGFIEWLKHYDVI